MPFTVELFIEGHDNKSRKDFRWAVIAYMVKKHGIGFIALSKHKQAAFIIAERILIMKARITKDVSFI